jgi:hypothetical protein
MLAVRARHHLAWSRTAGAASPRQRGVVRPRVRFFLSVRSSWRDGLPLHDGTGYVFVDECGVPTDLLRRYGRSPRGARLHDHTPCSHWQTHTVIAALRRDALTAPAVFDGPIDSASFRAYVEQVLVPTLRPGDVVILDNLAVHKQPEVRTAIQWTGAHLRFLPPTVRISIRSNWSSRNSKHFCAPSGRGTTISHSK